MADRHFDDMIARHPRMRELEPGEHDAAGRYAEAFKRYVNAATNLDLVRVTAREANDLYITGMVVDTYDIAFASRWRTCRQVYKFEPNLSRSLADTRLPDTMDVSVLDRMPYPVIYVCAPYELTYENGEKLRIDGFFALVDSYVRRGIDFEPIQAERSLLIFPLVAGHPEWRLFSALSLEVDTLGEMVDDIVAGDAFNPNELANDEYQRDSARWEINYILNHLLYLISENCEQEVVYRPSGNGKRRNKTSQSTIHAVGTRVGRAIGQAKVHYRGERHDGTGRSPRTHVRCGHFHSFWVGPRSVPEERRLIVRWLDPLVVNADKGNAIDTVTHDAGRGR